MGTTISTIKSNCDTNNLTKSGPSLWLRSYSSSPTKSKPNKNSSSSRLFQRIRALRDPKVSIFPVLDQWITEGNKFKETQFHGFVRQLRARKQYSHALQVLFRNSISMYFVSICATNCVSPNDTVNLGELVPSSLVTLIKLYLIKINFSGYDCIS